MPLRYVKGDLLAARTECLVNTVNCVGVMGKGLALQIKNAFPDNFKAYAAACKRGEVRLGHVFVYDAGPFARPRYIINFPTKDHWRSNSRPEDIRQGLKALAHEVKERGIRSIALPPLGCGLGALAWQDVKPLVQSELEALHETDIDVYEPSVQTTPLPSLSNAADMTPGRAALLVLMERYLSMMCDPFVTLLVAHKLMYFLQEAGEPLKLNIMKHHYGPYAENLRHVLTKMNGVFLTGYDPGKADAPEQTLTLLPGSPAQAREALRNSPGTTERIARVTDIIEGFEDELCMELLASVHWVMTREGAQTAEEALALIHGWNPRKARIFSAREVGIAFNHLREKAAA